MVLHLVFGDGLVVGLALSTLSVKVVEVDGLFVLEDPNGVSLGTLSFCESLVWS